MDTQLDHLNKYMERVEERLKAHNDKLMETLRQQREEREKRRQSFHEVRSGGWQTPENLAIAFKKDIGSTRRCVDFWIAISTLYSKSIKDKIKK